MDRTTLYGNCVVRVNLKDRKGTGANKRQLVGAVVSLDEDLLTNGVFVMKAASVGAEKPLIDFGLSKARKREDVGNERYVEEHVALEDNCARREVVE